MIILFHSMCGRLVYASRGDVKRLYMALLFFREEKKRLETHLEKKKRCAGIFVFCSYMYVPP